MSYQSILILGATSSIARSLAGQFAVAGARIHLAGRDSFEVNRIARDLSIRSECAVSSSVFDALDFASHPMFFKSAVDALGGLDLLIIAAGAMGSQADGEKDFTAARRTLDTNFTGIASILTFAANAMEEQHHGIIAVISSVAGDRGRRKNYLYGSAKGGLSLFLQGLRARMQNAGVHVLTVKPGFVDTAMTFGEPDVMFAASPDKVARDIARAIRHHRDVLYTPWFWRPIMCLLRSLPEGIAKKIKK